MTSGTLAYSFGLGKAVVSTPYWHARELLADGRGILVPFGDAAAIGSEIAGLLTDDPRRQAMRKRAYASSRSMTWERTAERYLTAVRKCAARASAQSDRAARPGRCASRDSHAAAGDADRSSSVDVRRHRAVPACRPFRAGSRSRLLRRRQCPGAVAGLCAQRSRRAAPARGLDGPVRRLRPARLESGYQAVSQLHELRSTLARRSRFGGQPWADTLGLGRMRAQRCECVAAALGHRIVRRSAAAGGELQLAARVGLHAARAGRLLRRDRRGFLSQAYPAAARRQADVHPVGRRDAGLGLVRGRACPTTTRACRRR